MVRMTDLVRGKAPSAPPTPPPESGPPPAPPTDPEKPDPASTPVHPTSSVRAGAAPNKTADRGRRDAPPEPTSPTGDPSTPPAEEIFGVLQSFLAGLRARPPEKPPFPWAELRQLVEVALQSLEASAELFWIANRAGVPGDVDYLAFHHARVAVLALRLGANLGRPRDELIGIGLAACLMDVGLWQFPPAALRRLEALNAQEQTQYRAHPRLGAELIQRWLPPVPDVAEMVLQHHEREQGQGFPQGLTATAIHPGAKILGLVDTYTALTASSSSKMGLSSHDAIRELVRSKHEAFPPAFIKALLSEISVFPPGTMVRLNTGEVGAVVAVNRNHPLRPRVEIRDARGQRLVTPKVIDLSETPFVYITGPVSEGAR